MALSDLLHAIYVDKNAIRKCKLEDIEKYGFVINRQLSMNAPIKGQELNELSTSGIAVFISWWKYFAKTKEVPKYAYPRKKKAPEDGYNNFERLLLSKVKTV